MVDAERTLINRHEFEYEIPKIEAEEMLQLCVGTVIKKKRYEILYENHTWEIDVFEEENDGLVVAEIELSSEDEQFEKPPWLGNDVSEDFRYLNTYLSKHPFTTWEK